MRERWREVGRWKGIGLRGRSASPIISCSPFNDSFHFILARVAGTWSPTPWYMGGHAVMSSLFPLQDAGNWLLQISACAVRVRARFDASEPRTCQWKHKKSRRRGEAQGWELTARRVSERAHPLCGAASIALTVLHTVERPLHGCCRQPPDCNIVTSTTGRHVHVTCGIGTAVQCLQRSLMVRSR